jgi:O-antigen/teichoic acid export membrane protein
MFFIGWIIMLVDSITRKFKNDTDKVVWILVIVLTGILGALIYYFVVYKKDRGKHFSWFWWTLLILAIIIIVLVILFFIFYVPLFVKH